MAAIRHHRERRRGNRLLRQERWLQARPIFLAGHGFMRCSARIVASVFAINRKPGIRPVDAIHIYELH